MESPYLNDLLWLMEGHFIESDIDLSQYWQADWWDKFQVLSCDPEPLERAIHACKSHFLGSYFEVLFSFAIRHFSTFTVLLDHVQISEAGKTLGEVDMLVETQDGSLLQFEIAIKFYLERPDLYPDHWIGPNKNDSLRKKTSRARDHQLTILETKSAKKQLHNITMSRPIKAYLLIFGRLFLSLNDKVNASEYMEHAGVGGWIHVSKIHTLISEFSCVLELEKPHWLSLPNFTRAYMPFTTECIDRWIEDFKHDARPKHLCLWRESKNGTSRYSVFVVPDTW